ncbi:hypothetical protein GOV11_00770, partial [Candidatus Woesearchaeota archaeon]|nr:hypothetical protein [Candidatus Woesearchaeota archaeon]
FLQEGKVRNLVETQRYKDRTLRGGIQYEPPPAAFDIIEASDLELIDKLKTTTRKDIATALAMTLGLGGVYAEEVCARADIDKSRSDLKSGELKSIVKALREIQNAEISPHVSEKRVFPFKPVSVSTSPVEGSFLQALSRFVDAPSDGKETKQGSAKKDKAAAIVKSQKKRIRQLEEEFPKEQEKAEKIYEEYMLMKDILDTVRTAREKKQDIEKALSKYKQVKAYHPKNAQIEVELD